MIRAMNFDPDVSLPVVFMKGYAAGYIAALAAGAQSAETSETSAQSEGRQSGHEVATPNPCSSTEGPGW